nr:immunoglobulin light chain junction region [Macaca mulatta]
CQQGYDTPFSF